VIAPEIKENLFLRLDKLSPDTKAKWGSMNVAQMLAHMNDAFKICLGMKPAVNKSNWFNQYVKFNVALVLPAWPKGEATADEMAQDKQGTSARDFYTELEFLKTMMEVFNERGDSKLKPHPMFGALTKQQWADLFAKHLDHHLKQFGV